MKFRCVDNTGYEDRLTLDKVYDLNWLFPKLGADDLVAMTFDDGTTGEVFGERFEKCDREERIQVAMSAKEMTLEQELTNLVNHNKITPEDALQVLAGKLSIDGALQNKAKIQWPEPDPNSKDPVERLWAIEDKKRDMEDLIKLVQKGLLDAKYVTAILDGKMTASEGISQSAASTFQTQYLGDFAPVKEAASPRDVEYLAPGDDIVPLMRATEEHIFRKTL
jgi:hypothetical protein